MTFTRTLLSVVLVSSFLVGCNSTSSPNSECIKPTLVSSLARTPLHTAGEDDSRSATLSITQTGCGGSKEELLGGNGDIGINIALTIPEARKATGKAKRVSFPVFVALLDKEENVSDRRDENIEVTITDRALTHTHKIAYHPPEGVDAGSPSHRILVGFNGRVIAVHSANAENQPVKKSRQMKHRKGKVRRKAPITIQNQE